MHVRIWCLLSDDLSFFTAESRRLQRTRLYVHARGGGRRRECSSLAWPGALFANCPQWAHDSLLFSPQTKLSRLCEQDKVVRTQEDKLQQLYREKVTTRCTSVSSYIQLCLYRRGAKWRTYKPKWLYSLYSLKIIRIAWLKFICRNLRKREKQTACLSVSVVSYGLVPAGFSRGQRHYGFVLSTHPSLHMSIPVSWMPYLRNIFRGFQIWQKWSLWLNFCPILVEFKVTDIISKIMVLFSGRYSVVNHKREIVTIFAATLLFSRCICYVLFVLIFICNR